MTAHFDPMKTPHAGTYEWRTTVPNYAILRPNTPSHGTNASSTRHHTVWSIAMSRHLLRRLMGHTVEESGEVQAVVHRPVRAESASELHHGVNPIAILTMGPSYRAESDARSPSRGL